jgi:hypothetical protein
VYVLHEDGDWPPYHLGEVERSKAMYNVRANLGSIKINIISMHRMNTIKIRQHKEKTL